MFFKVIIKEEEIMPFSVLSWNILGPATGDVQDYGFIQGDYGRLGKHLDIIHQYQAYIS